MEGVLSRAMACTLAATPAMGLEVGECTWYAYLRAQDHGWKLDFAAMEGRDARTWPDIVRNARTANEPAPGAIMVLDGWPGNRPGHVAFVEQVISPAVWVITHTNWHVGGRAALLQGVPIYRATCRREGPRVRVGDHGPVVPLIGFLVRDR